MRAPPPPGGLLPPLSRRCALTAGSEYSPNMSRICEAARPPTAVGNSRQNWLPQICRHKAGPQDSGYRRRDRALAIPELFNAFLLGLPGLLLRVHHSGDDRRGRALTADDEICAAEFEFEDRAPIGILRGLGLPPARRALQLHSPQASIATTPHQHCGRRTAPPSPPIFSPPPPKTTSTTTTPACALCCCPRSRPHPRASHRGRGVATGRRAFLGLHVSERLLLYRYAPWTPASRRCPRGRSARPSAAPWPPPPRFSAAATAAEIVFRRRDLLAPPPRSSACTPPGRRGGGRRARARAAGTTSTTVNSTNGPRRAMGKF